MDFGGLTGPVIGAAIKVHNRLGPGLLESAYKACLGYELVRSGLRFEAEKPLPLIYDSVHLDCGYRADFVIERELIVEVKRVAALAPIFEAQLLSYMKLSSCSTGLLINFHSLLLRDGIRRMTLRPSPHSPNSL